MRLFQHYTTVAQSNGAPIEGASVEVIDLRTGLPATIYADRDKGARTNPFTSTVDGEVLWWGVAGSYEVNITAGLITRTIPVVLGIAAEDSVRETAGQVLSALRVVYVDGGTAHAASATTALAYRLCGVTITAAGIGEEVVIQQSGPIEDSSFTLDPALPVFLGAGGVITQTPPASGAIVVVGRAITPTRFFVDFQQPIELTEV